MESEAISYSEINGEAAVRQMATSSKRCVEPC